MKSVEALVAIDVGSTTCKAAALDRDGNLLALAAKEVPCAYPRPEWAEVDPEHWWQVVCDLLRSVVAEAAATKPWRPVALAVTGLMHAPVLIDRNGRTLCAAQLWMDRRCREEAEILGRDYAALFSEQGMRPPRTTSTAPKLLWLARHHRQVLDAARWLLLPKDYIRYRLTGEVGTDPSDAAGTGMYSRLAADWVEPVVHACGGRLDLMPPILSATSCAGRLRESG